MTPETLADMHKGTLLGDIRVARQVERMLRQHPVIYRHTLRWCAESIEMALGIKSDPIQEARLLLVMLETFPGATENIGGTGVKFSVCAPSMQSIIANELTLGGWIVEDGPPWRGDKYRRGWRWEKESSEEQSSPTNQYPPRCTSRGEKDG